MSGAFKKTAVEIDEQDFQDCPCLKKRKELIVKFVNTKEYLQILRVKKERKSLDQTELDFPEITKIFVNKTLLQRHLQ